MSQISSSSSEPMKPGKALNSLNTRAGSIVDTASSFFETVASNLRHKAMPSVEDLVALGKEAPRTVVLPRMQAQERLDLLLAAISGNTDAIQTGLEARAKSLDASIVGFLAQVKENLQRLTADSLQTRQVATLFLRDTLQSLKNRELGTQEESQEPPTDKHASLSKDLAAYAVYLDCFPLEEPLPIYKSPESNPNLTPAEKLCGLLTSLGERLASAPLVTPDSEPVEGTALLRRKLYVDQIGTEEKQMTDRQEAITVLAEILGRARLLPDNLDFENDRSTLDSLQKTLDSIKSKFVYDDGIYDIVQSAKKTLSPVDHMRTRSLRSGNSTSRTSGAM